MANTNTPFGLKPFRGGGGYMWNEQGSVYSIPSDDSNAYYTYDIVKAAASSDANGVSNVALITNGTDPIRGSIVGIFPVYPTQSIQAAPLTLEQPYIPATKSGKVWYVLVVDDPSTRFIMQDDGITTANLVAASANLNSTFTQAAGSTPQSYSGSVLLSSSFAATATFNLGLEGLVQIPGNVYGAYAKWQVRINQSDMSGPTGGTGV